MTTPEGPAATRCPDCDRPLGDTWAHECGPGTQDDHYRIGFERLRARLVEVERERDARYEGPPFVCAHCKQKVWHVYGGMDRPSGCAECFYGKPLRAAESRALAAEARLSEVEGALREARNWFAANTMPYRAQREAIIARIDAALSGSPPISGDESTRAFANLVELLLDQAKDVIGARAMETGSQRLHDMAREAAKLCAVARNMQSLPARHGAQGDPATQSNRSGWTAETPCRQSSPPISGAEVLAHLLAVSAKWEFLSDDRGAFRAILKAAAEGKRASYTGGIYSETPFCAAAPEKEGQ